MNFYIGVQADVTELVLLPCMHLLFALLSCLVYFSVRHFGSLLQCGFVLFPVCHCISVSPHCIHPPVKGFEQVRSRGVCASGGALFCWLCFAEGKQSH